MNLTSLAFEFNVLTDHRCDAVEENGKPKNFRQAPSPQTPQTSNVKIQTIGTTPSLSNTNLELWTINFKLSILPICRKHNTPAATPITVFTQVNALPRTKIKPAVGDR